LPEGHSSPTGGGKQHPPGPFSVTGPSGDIAPCPLRFPVACPPVKQHACFPSERPALRRLRLVLSVGPVRRIAYSLRLPKALPGSLLGCGSRALSMPAGRRSDQRGTVSLPAWRGRGMLRAPKRMAKPCDGQGLSVGETSASPVQYHAGQPIFQMQLFDAILPKTSGIS
jgi:hypothetical protein